MITLRLIPYCTAVLVAALPLCPLAYSQEPLTERLSDPGQRVMRPKQDETAAKTNNWEVGRNVIIDGGKSVVLDSKFDFSLFSQVAVSVRAAVDSPADLSDMVMQGYWGVPELEDYNIAEYKHGKTFAYTNAGGALFQVYGPRFRLVLKNNGDTRIKLQQVVVFPRSW